MTNKIAKDVAENEFNRFIEAFDLDLDESTMSEEDKEGLYKEKDKIIKSLMKGNLVIDENGIPIFTPARSNVEQHFTFHEPTGATLMAMDRRKKNEDVGKMLLALGDMCKTDAKIFSKLVMADLKVCIAIFTLLVA